MLIRKLILFTALCCAGHAAHAMEVYRLILKTCAVETGIVIDADQSILGLITTSGQYHVLERDQISTILVYNTVNNPFREIQQGNETRRALLDVYVEDTSKPLFTGWAVRFVDDLAFFYGIDGKSYNIDIHKITMVDQAHSDTSTLSPANGNETLAFDYGRDFPECGLTTGGSAAAGSIAPVQILSDQIKIEKWFLNLQRGFTRLQQFRERTLFYAKPMIYREDSRFGVFQLINGSKGKGKYGMEPPVSIPAYLFRSGGKPFLYQHQTTFGSKISDLAPTVEPVTAFTSDIKAHLFHGSFVLNLNNPAPGEGVIKALAESQLDYFREVASQKTDVLTTFHYLALSGVDYRRFSFSGGYFFPVFGIQTGGKEGVYREIRASTSTPVLRLRYTLSDLRFSALYGRTKYQSSKPQKEDISVFNSYEFLPYDERTVDPYIYPDSSTDSVSEDPWPFLDTTVDRFKFDNHYARLSVDWDITPTLQLTVDEIMLRGNYRETLTGRTHTYDGFQTIITESTSHNRVDYSHYTTAIRIRRVMGDKVAVALQLNHGNRYQKSLFNNGRDKTNEASDLLYATFELLL